MAKTDVFPSSVSYNYSKLPVIFDFQTITDTNSTYPFIFFLDIETSKVYYQKLKQDRNTTSHFKDLTTRLDRSKKLRQKLSSWFYVQKKLLLPLKENRKNADTRTCFKINNIFLVKPGFTTGQRTVDNGTVHLLQIHKAAVIFHFLPRLSALKVKKVTRRFASSEQSLYVPRTLHAFKNYVVPEGTVYILHTLQNCIFSLHILPKDTHIDILHRNPLKEVPQPKSIDLYREPVATPQIEDAVLENSDEDDDGPSTSNHGMPPPGVPGPSTGVSSTSNFKMPPPRVPRPKTGVSSSSNRGMPPPAFDRLSITVSSTSDYGMPHLADAPLPQDVLQDLVIPPQDAPLPQDMLQDLAMPHPPDAPLSQDVLQDLVMPQDVSLSQNGPADAPMPLADEFHMPPPAAIFAAQPSVATPPPQPDVYDHVAHVPKQTPARTLNMNIVSWYKNMLQPKHFSNPLETFAIVGEGEQSIPLDLSKKTSGSPECHEPPESIRPPTSDFIQDTSTVPEILDLSYQPSGHSQPVLPPGIPQAHPNVLSYAPPATGSTSVIPQAHPNVLSYVPRFQLVIPSSQLHILDDHQTLPTASSAVVEPASLESSANVVFQSASLESSSSAVVEPASLESSSSVVFQPASLESSSSAVVEPASLESSSSVVFQPASLESSFMFEREPDNLKDFFNSFNFY